MSYKFSLDVLLDHRQKLENEARRIWVEAQTKVDEATRELNGMYDLVDHTRAESGKIKTQGVVVGASQMPRLTMNDDFVAGSKIRIEMQRKKIRELKMAADMLQEAVVEAAKERKTLEKLKEKRKAEYKLAERKKELKENDELVILRHKPERE